MTQPCYSDVNKMGTKSLLLTRIFLSIILILVMGLSYAIGNLKQAVKLPIKPAINTTIPLSKCPDTVIKSFKIVGKIPKSGSGGEKFYQLRLQGIITNQGDDFPGLMGNAVITEHPQGARQKQLSRIRIQNLNLGKNVLVGALSTPLSASTEFLPKYQLSLKVSSRLPRVCAKRKKNKTSDYIKYIQPRDIMVALKR